MNVNGFTGWVYHLCEWIVRLAIINTLWVLFSLAGLGLFGWAPATAAVFAVMRQWFLYKRDIPLFKTFFAFYKKDFIRANAVGLLLAVGGWSFYFSASTLIHLGQWSKMIVGSVMLIGLFLFLITVMFIFPVFCHYNISLKQLVRYSLMIGVSHLHYWMLMAAALVLTYILFSALPGLMMFYIVSIPAAIIMYLSLKVFQSIEENANIREKSGSVIESKNYNSAML